MFLYRNFKQICPSGRMSSAQWRQIFRLIFKGATDYEFADRIFLAIAGTRSQKLITFEDLVFCLYDLRALHDHRSICILVDEPDQEGLIDESAFLLYTKCIFDLNSSIGNHCSSGDAATFGMFHAMGSSHSNEKLINSKPTKDQMLPWIENLGKQQFRALDTNKDAYEPLILHQENEYTETRVLIANLPARRPSKKPLITRKNVEARLELARKHLEWSVADWRRVLWSDESKYNLFSSDGIRYVRRSPNQKKNPKCQVPTVKHGGGSVMVWGSFSRDGMGPLNRIEEIMKAVNYKKILEEQMLPDARIRLAEYWIFQQDNDPKHASKLVKKFLSDNNVDVLKWPAHSPDLNPIEHLWEELDRRIRNRTYKKTGKLFNALSKEWSKIPLGVVMKLVDSMSRRCEAFIAAKGYATKY
uniref:Tc1-like transposase DDE domain-containing protein n=1 Tax=Ditylenchus dipsaci TaxID=166011 RepID=A0A915DXW8_9BILA